MPNNNGENDNGLCMKKDIYDVCIVGGGINGCGIARDASGRGYKTLLLEKEDLSSGTSSASTKLIHGGLRYLEFYEFGLVRKALKEREILLKIAPHITRPMRFILPYMNGMRPLWLMQVGVWIYDHLFQSKILKKSIKTNIKNDYLNKNIKNGIAYSDGWVEDSRMVVLNAMDAAENGADILRNTECKSIIRDKDLWCVKTSKGEFHARMVINAAGPWAQKLMENSVGIESSSLRLVKGSHIIIPKLYDDEESYIFQNDDGRIVFVIPYEGEYSLVGTTEVDIGHDPNQKIEIDFNETRYLVDTVNKFFNTPITRSDIVDTYAGVRPLLDEQGDAKSVTRDYKLDMQMMDGMGYLTVLGGKLTTYRILAEEAMKYVDEYFDRETKSWTANKSLPGGDFDNRDTFMDEQLTQYNFLPSDLVKRYVRTYGTSIENILNNVRDENGLGIDFGDGVYQCEIDYLIAREFVKNSEDVLKRRTKLYLHCAQSTQISIDNYIKKASLNG
jgi:glycerol-3-phosphate dehydrogenase